MTLGEKIKKARKEKRLTQAKLAKDKITRNMLSAIECGKAAPSLETLRYLSEQLSLPLSFLLSDDDDLFFYQKREAMPGILALFRDEKYSLCIKAAEKLEKADDEIALLLASCYFELGRRSVLGGSLVSGKKQLKTANEYFKKTAYDTSRMEHSSIIYMALAENIKAPMLILDPKSFEESISERFDYELFKYISLDPSYKYTTPKFAKHMAAKELMKSRKYNEALSLLRDIEDDRSKDSYNAYLIFGVYTDAEYCYKQLFDFENAYRYASKRLSLIEGFET